MRIADRLPAALDECAASIGRDVDRVAEPRARAGRRLAEGADRGRRECSRRNPPEGGATGANVDPVGRSRIRRIEGESTEGTGALDHGGASGRGEVNEGTRCHLGQRHGATVGAIDLHLIRRDAIGMEELELPDRLIRDRPDDVVGRSRRIREDDRSFLVLRQTRRRRIDVAARQSQHAGRCELGAWRTLCQGLLDHHIRQRAGRAISNHIAPGRGHQHLAEDRVAAGCAIGNPDVVAGVDAREGRGVDQIAHLGIRPDSGVVLVLVADQLEAVADLARHHVLIVGAAVGSGPAIGKDKVAVDPLELESAAVEDDTGAARLEHAAEGAGGADGRSVTQVARRVVVEEEAGAGWRLGRRPVGRAVGDPIGQRHRIAGGHPLEHVAHQHGQIVVAKRFGADRPSRQRRNRGVAALEADPNRIGIARARRRFHGDFIVGAAAVRTHAHLQQIEQPVLTGAIGLEGGGDRIALGAERIEQRLECGHDPIDRGLDLGRIDTRRGGFDVIDQLLRIAVGGQGRCNQVGQRGDVDRAGAGIGRDADQPGVIKGGDQHERRLRRGAEIAGIGAVRVGLDLAHHRAGGIKNFQTGISQRSAGGGGARQHH